jgi:Ca-activated chloride channel family protein
MGMLVRTPGRFLVMAAVMIAGASVLIDGTFAQTAAPPQAAVPPSGSLTQPTQAQPTQAQPVQTQPAQTPPAADPLQPPRPTSGVQGPTFRSGIDVVSLNVTVTDGAKSFIRDLERGDFAVFEDGVKQDVTFFTKAQTPIALSLLLDTSASMEDKMKLTQEAAVGFVERLRPEDLAQVVDFDNRVTILQNFTPGHESLERAIRQTVAGGSTSLHNAVYIALKELKKVKATNTEEVRRQTIIVLSDGEDTSSLVPFEEVLELAKRSDVVIYTIGIRGRDVTGRGFNEAEFVLRQFAQETGGRAYFPTTAAELGGIYQQIGDELASQYLLAYVSRNSRHDGQWRRIVVRTTRPNTQARTKQGYYGPRS